MVSATYFLAAISAVAGVVSASPAHQLAHLHRRRAYYGYSNDTAVAVPAVEVPAVEVPAVEVPAVSSVVVPSVPLTTGVSSPVGEQPGYEAPAPGAVNSGKPVAQQPGASYVAPVYVNPKSTETPPAMTAAPTVAPLETATYTTTATSYVTVTYTLGDGRAITKTITKEIPQTLTAYGEEVSSIPRQTSTSTSTVHITIPGQEKPAATPAAQGGDQKFTATVYETWTSTQKVVVTATRAAAPLYPVQVIPPYQNGTSPHSTTTSLIYTTTTLTPAVPIATGGAPLYYAY